MNSTPQQQSKFIGYLCVLGATAIWAGNYVIARGLSDSIPPVSLAFWRWLVAVIVFTPFAVKKVISDWDSIKKHIGYFSLTALLGITTFNTLLYIASHTTTALNLSLISITFPIFILILSRFFYREPVTIVKAIGILLVAAGVVILITKGRLSTLLTINFAIGDIWMLIAALVFAFYSILLKNKPKGISTGAFQYTTFILGLLFLLPFFLWESALTPPVSFTTNIVLAILYVGVISSLIAYFLWNKAIEIVGPSKAAVIYYTSPLFSGFLAFLFLNEAISMVHLYSAILIIAGILTANYESGRTREAKGNLVDNDELFQ